MRLVRRSTSEVSKGKELFSHYHDLFFLLSRHNSCSPSYTTAPTGGCIELLAFL